MNKREAGAKYEQIAAEFLQQSGMLILERNFRCRSGEIDLIGRHEGYLVFVEVKYRASDKSGMPEEAVGYQKQRKICRVADFYRYVKNLPEQTPVRYDVVAVLREQCIWYQNAFVHIYA